MVAKERGRFWGWGEDILHSGLYILAGKDSFQYEQFEVVLSAQVEKADGTVYEQFRARILGCMSAQTPYAP